MKRLRRPGSPWRVLAWEYTGKGEYAGAKVDIGSDQHPGTEFDELVVGQWLHVEQMNATQWWMNVGGVTIWVTADRDGRAKYVTVFGPGTEAGAVEGCRYEVSWPGGA